MLVAQSPLAPSSARLPENSLGLRGGLPITEFQEEPRRSFDCILAALSREETRVPGAEHEAGMLHGVGRPQLERLFVEPG
jgi:hypothetical protein